MANSAEPQLPVLTDPCDTVGHRVFGLLRHRSRNRRRAAVQTCGGAKSALWTFGVIVMDRDLDFWCFVAVVAAFVALETALVIYGLS